MRYHVSTHGDRRRHPSPCLWAMAARRGRPRAPGALGALGEGAPDSRPHRRLCSAAGSVRPATLTFPGVEAVSGTRAGARPPEVRAPRPRAPRRRGLQRKGRVSASPAADVTGRGHPQAPPRRPLLPGARTANQRLAPAPAASEPGRHFLPPGGGRAGRCGVSVGAAAQRNSHFVRAPGPHPDGRGPALRRGQRFAGPPRGRGCPARRHGAAGALRAAARRLRDARAGRAEP